VLLAAARSNLQHFIDRDDERLKRFVPSVEEGQFRERSDAKGVASCSF
jgi:hypothetical protein